MTQSILIKLVYIY